MSAVFSPDGARVLSGSFDTTVKLWNLATGQLLTSLLASRDGEWLVLTPAGFFAASPNGSDMLSVVRGFEVQPTAQFQPQTRHRAAVRRTDTAVREFKCQVHLLKCT